MTINAQFQWQRHPKSETLLLTLIEECSRTNPMIADLQEALLQQTSTRLFDWIDHLIIGRSDELETALAEDGFLPETTTASYRVLHHPGAQFPRVVVEDRAESIKGLAVAVDSIADFLMARGISRKIEGTPMSDYRRCCISIEEGIALWVVERRGTRDMEPTYADEKASARYLQALELWKTRPRDLEDEDASMACALNVAEQIIGLVGRDLAAWVVLQVEREYWQMRNTAAQLQKNRQDRLGMGWANHDHHTFRSSRRHFAQLVRLFEMLGFYCRERFYAGQEAGWGAQVMEHSTLRLILFLDVDLLPHEVEVDFRHQPLPALEKLGTVGLWCALHGDSILNAGMHHMEAQFMFEELKQDLAKIGVGMMEPFSAFSYLHQAFTKGEIWKVSSRRLQNLLKSGLITESEAEKFSTQGAVGSHLENLQRREGYKGFNQKNVSFIIQQTDPRNINF